MGGKRSKSLTFDTLEGRVVLSAGAPGISALAAANPHHPAAQADTFVANLTLVNPAAPNDHASGVVTVRFSGNARQASVTGSLSKISNVSAIVLRLPTIKTTTTTNGMTTTVSNFQTVAVLVKPGSGSGAFPHVTFGLTIDRFSLIGQLVGRPLSQLLKQTQMGNVSVVVLTNNGIDPTTTMAPGNMQTGEIEGTLEPRPKS